MTDRRRINVSSGRPLEAKAHYSRALRVGDFVLQSGTTAIDRDGNVLGDDVETQIAAILDIARESMAAAEGAFEDVVRARLYVKGTDQLDRAEQVFCKAFADIKPAVTTIPISELARPAQLIEVELEAIDNAASDAERRAKPPHASSSSDSSSVVRMGNKIMLGGITSMGHLPIDAVHEAMTSLRQLITSAGGAFEDLVSIKFFVTDVTQFALLNTAVKSALDGVKPVVTIMGVPPLADRSAELLVEAEAYAGAGHHRRDSPHPQWSMFSETVSVDSEIYISDTGPLDNSGTVQSPGDWAAHRDLCTAKLDLLLQSIGASLDDVVVRRYFTRADAEMNRGYGEGPAWFKKTRPTALGCRIAGHTDPEILMSLEAHAIRGAGQDIEWRTLG